MSRRSENENDGNSGIRGVTVVGGGVIGASWAALFLAPGLSVTVGDPRPGIDEAVRTYVAQAAPALKALGLDTSSLTARLSFAPDLATAARETDLVQENGPEKIDDKIAIAGLASSGPAQQAGLRTGDIVTAVDGVPVGDLADFFRRIWAIGVAGVAVPLTVYRDRDTMDVTVISTDRSKLLKGPRLQ